MSDYRVINVAGNEVQPGDAVWDFRGEEAEFVRVSRGPEYNGTVKVVVVKSGLRREYYAQVFELTVERVS